jgi:DNA-binding transcriptional regulator of glucitol operon
VLSFAYWWRHLQKLCACTYAVVVVEEDVRVHICSFSSCAMMIIVFYAEFPCCIMVFGDPLSH